MLKGKANTVKYLSEVLDSLPLKRPKSTEGRVSTKVYYVDEFKLRLYSSQNTRAGTLKIRKEVIDEVL